MYMGNRDSSRILSAAVKHVDQVDLHPSAEVRQSLDSRRRPVAPPARLPCTSKLLTMSIAPDDPFPFQSPAH